MANDSFFAQRHPHRLGPAGLGAPEEWQALADDMAQLGSMGITLTLVANYAVGPYRYTSLTDALAQLRRTPSPDHGR